MNGNYGYSQYGGGYGWTSSGGYYTGYGYGSNPHSSWGWQSNQWQPR
jgi:hypothetical protein